jgi:hypothetical protein
MDRFSVILSFATRDRTRRGGRCEEEKRTQITQEELSVRFRGGCAEMATAVKEVTQQ